MCDVQNYTQRTMESFRRNADRVNGLLNGFKDPEKLQQALDDLDTQRKDIQFQPRYRLLLHLSEHWNEVPTDRPRPTISMESVKNTSDEDLDFYAEKLSALTKRPENRNVSPRKETFLDCLNGKHTDEDTWRKIALGLRLNYWDAEDLFLRVLPDFDGFNFRKIDELCLVFALELQKTIKEYDTLLANCRKILQKYQRAEAPVDSYQYSTAAARKDFLTLLDQWREAPGQQDQNLFQWVKENWQFFDGGRYTAKYVYYALARLCTQCDSASLCQTLQKDRKRPTLFHTIRSISKTIREKRLAESADEADTMADTLLTMAEHYQGWQTFQGAEVNNTLKRNAKRTIVSLLSKEGTREASKRDILTLLWMLAVQLWTHTGGRPDMEALQKRADDFASSANYLLNLAQLQEFYWPHPLEYSMLLSILSGSTVNMMYYFLLTNVEKGPL